MIMEDPIFQEMAQELLILLDEEIRLLHLRNQQFEELYESILHRDDERMEELLAEMVCAQQEQGRLDTKLQAGRTMIARSLGCKVGEMKLAMLIERLDEKKSVEMEYKRQQIILLAEQLKRKHLDTAVLLSESARINRMLLEGILPSNGTVTTYNTDGSTGWRDSTGLVDAEI